MKKCYSCKKAVTSGREVSRRDVCPFCGSDVRCCLNCKFYDRLAPKQCNEPVSENVKEKEKANFCDYFVLADSGIGGLSDVAVEKARKSLDNLFKK